MLFHVGLGFRLAVVGGLRRTADAVDGNYTIYGTSTGLEVYEGDGLVYVRCVGRRCFRRLPPGQLARPRRGFLSHLAG